MEKIDQITFKIEKPYSNIFLNMTESEKSAWIESAIRIKIHCDHKAYEDD